MYGFFIFPFFLTVITIFCLLLYLFAHHALLTWFIESSDLRSEPSLITEGKEQLFKDFVCRFRSSNFKSGWVQCEVLGVDQISHMH